MHKLLARQDEIIEYVDKKIVKETVIVMDKEVQAETVTYWASRCSFVAPIFDVRTHMNSISGARGVRGDPFGYACVRVI